MLNISQSKKTSEKGGRTHQKRVGARNARCNAGRGGGPTCTTRTSPLVQKKKKRPHNRFCITAFMETKEYRKQRGGGEGDLKDAWEAREIGEFTQQCSVSPSSKGMRCSHVNREGAANARYGGDCLAPPYPSFLSCRILIKSLLISTWSVYTSIYHITEVNCLGDSFPVVPLIS